MLGENDAVAQSDFRASGRQATKNKGEINSLWEIFEEMRKEMIETKKAISAEIQEAVDEKNRIESKLETICSNPDNVKRWRKIQNSLALAILQSRAEIRQKLHGITLFAKKDSDEVKYRRISQVTIIESEKKVRKSYIVYPDSRFHLIWGYLLIFLLGYTIIMAPLSLALIDYTNFPAVYFLDLIVNCMFFIDIIVCMRTALDEDRDSQMVIFINYAKSWLVFDIVAIIPFDILLGDSVYGLTLITRIPRFLRIFRVFKMVKLGGNVSKNRFLKKIFEALNITAAVSKLLQFFVTMVIIIHVTGCIWIFIAKSDDYGPGTWVYE